jgi:hypothetical protein
VLLRVLLSGAGPPINLDMGGRAVLMSTLAYAALTSRRLEAPEVIAAHALIIAYATEHEGGQGRSLTNSVVPRGSVASG